MARERATAGPGWLDSCLDAAAYHVKGLFWSVWDGLRWHADVGRVIYLAGLVLLGLVAIVIAVVMITNMIPEGGF